MGVQLTNPGNEVGIAENGEVVIGRASLRPKSLEMISCSSTGISPDLAAAITPSWLTGSPLWLHLAFVISYALGLVLAPSRETPHAHGKVEVRTKGSCRFSPFMVA
jgi:hypothetical protein